MNSNRSFGARSLVWVVHLLGMEEDPQGRASSLINWCVGVLLICMGAILLDEWSVWAGTLMVLMFVVMFCLMMLGSVVERLQYDGRWAAMFDSGQKELSDFSSNS